MAVELGKFNIRVNSINPGAVFTDMYETYHDKMQANLKNEGIQENTRELMTSKIPLGKAVIEMSNVVDLTLIVLSDKMGMLHGETIFLDGGYCLT